MVTTTREETFTPPTNPEDEDPKHSLAAQCISFQYIGKLFRPEFTHQFFDREWIRGYQPISVIGSHSSHQKLQECSHVLDIQIQLAPSWCFCTVAINQSLAKRKIPTRSTDSSKRARIEDELDNSPVARGAESETEDEKEDRKLDPPPGDGKTQEEESSNSEKGEIDVKSTENDDSSYKNESASSCSSLIAPEPEEGSTRSHRMPIEELLNRLSKGHPLVIATAVNNESTQKTLQEDEYLSNPVGSVVKEFQTQDQKFVISLADGAQCVNYHTSVQTLAYWFIENADCVDVANLDGGYWKVLYLFQKHSHGYALIGYVTLFHFHSPFKKPKPGVVLRICQALVLPPFQRCGHGRRLMEAIYEVARQNDDIVEITVEDPAPSFSMLRNRVDFMLVQQAVRDQDNEWAQSLEDVSNKDFFQPLSDKDALQAAASLKLIPRQVQIAVELCKLQILHQEGPLTESLQQKYRLMVKKRLVKVHREELGGLATKADKQALLQRQFEQTLREYHAILKIEGGE